MAQRCAALWREHGARHLRREARRASEERAGDGSSHNRARGLAARHLCAATGKRAKAGERACANHKSVALRERRAATARLARQQPIRAR